MCGFVGYVNAENDTEKNKAVIKNMADRIVHRGPDDGQYYIDDGVSLGFRRLSIMDLEGGVQPMTNEDNTKVVVFNGEIYNFKELRSQLLEKGHVFKTNCDTEVLVHGYEEYGRELLNKLRGMFAFVIWDSKEKKLFGARDIFGIKPFFYYLNEGNFLFASEIKGFLSNPLFKKEFNEARLPDYLCFEYIPTTETMFKNVYKLEPGAYFEYKDGRFTTARYFTPEYNIDDTHDMKYWEDLIDETFKESVRVHSIADVEVGCFLSSGVDSSYAVHEMKKRNDIRTFSVGYAEEKYSELDRAIGFAEHEGVRNFNKKITAEEFFEVTPMVQYYMDEPLPNPSAIALYFLTKLASEQVKVVCSGEGADELFGGYHYYRDPLEFEKYMKVPQGIRTLLGNVAEKMPNFHGKRFLMRGRYPIEKSFIRNNYVYNHADLGKILKKDIPSEDPSYYTKPIFDEVAGQDDITKMQYADIRTWLVQDILVKADRMSMANSLELRVPFLDKEMLKIALRIPAKYRIDSETTKVALRHAAAKELPPEVSAMRKTGFLTPLNDWLKRDEFYNIVKEKFESDVAKEYFREDYLLKMLDEHKNGTAHNMKKIWSIYSFLLWYDKYFVEN